MNQEAEKRCKRIWQSCPLNTRWLAHQQAAQAQQNEFGLAPDDVPKQPGRLIARDLSQRLPGRSVEHIHEPRIVFLLEMMQCPPDEPMRAKLAAQRRQLR